MSVKPFYEEKSNSKLKCIIFTVLIILLLLLNAPISSFLKHYRSSLTSNDFDNKAYIKQTVSKAEGYKSPNDFFNDVGSLVQGKNTGVLFGYTGNDDCVPINGKYNDIVPLN